MLATQLAAAPAQKGAPKRTSKRGPPLRRGLPRAPCARRAPARACAAEGSSRAPSPEGGAGLGGHDHDAELEAQFSLSLEAALEQAERNAAAAAEALRLAEVQRDASTESVERQGGAPAGEGGGEGEGGSRGYSLLFNPFTDDVDEEAELPSGLASLEDAEEGDEGAFDMRVALGNALQENAVRRVPGDGAASSGAGPTAGAVPVEELEGWEVVRQADGVRLGVVHEVLEQSATSFLLHVRAVGAELSSPWQAANQTAAAVLEAPASFYLPLVDDIVPVVDAPSRRLVVAPPEGLLELYTGDDDMMQLMLALEKFAAAQFRQRQKRERHRRSAAKRGGGGGNGEASGDEGEAAPSMGKMPSRSALERAERHDLVRQIESHGGFADVAATLGMRVSRADIGYWDEPDTLDYEIGLFMAVYWEEYVPEGRPADAVWRHTLTGAVVEDDAMTEEVMAAGANDGRRYMPRRCDVIAADRWDLDWAIGKYGWYTRCAQELGRTAGVLRAGGASDASDDAGWIRLAALRPRLAALASEYGLPPDAMPTRAVMMAAGRTDLLAEVADAGGSREVAAALGLARAHSPEVALSLAQQVDVAKPLAHSRRRSARGPGVRAGRWNDLAAVVAEIVTVAASAELRAIDPRPDPAAHMPSRAALLALGRSDLVWALQKHSATVVRNAAGLKARPRGRPRKPQRA